MHGETNTPLHRIWRRFRVNRHRRIYAEWENYLSFKEWALSNGYEERQVMLRRRNRYLGYNPGNCYWLPKRKWITAFGETKSLIDWVRDKRCGVTHHELLRRRLDRGLDPEFAISYRRKKKETRGRPKIRGLRRVWKNIQGDCFGWTGYHHFRAWAEEIGWKKGWRLVKKDHWKEWSPANVMVVHRSEAFFYSGLDKHLIKAWGRRKTITEWLQDRRCRCNCREIFEERLKKGWKIEFAISFHPFWKLRLNKHYKLINSEGVERSIYWWSRSKTCKVTLKTLMERLRRGVPLDEALWQFRISPKKKRWRRNPYYKKRWINFA